METAMQALKRKDIDEKIKSFHADDFINALNKQIINIIACSLPKMIIYKSGMMSQLHSKEVKVAIDKIEAIKNEYVESFYGQEFVVNINLNYEE